MFRRFVAICHNSYWLRIINGAKIVRRLSNKNVAIGYDLRRILHCKCKREAEIPLTISRHYCTMSEKKHDLCDIFTNEIAPVVNDESVINNSTELILHNLDETAQNTVFPNDKIYEMFDDIASVIADFSDSNIIKLLEILDKINRQNEELFARDEHVLCFMKTLDKECANRCKLWDSKKGLMILQKFVPLNVKKCTKWFSNTVLKKCIKKRFNMQKENALLFVSLINKCQFFKWPLLNYFEIECYLEKHMDELNIEEISAFFYMFNNAKNHLHNTDVIRKVIRIFLDNFGVMSVFSGKAFLVIIAHSVNVDMADLIFELNSVLAKNMDNLDLSWLHATIIMNQTVLIYDDEFLRKAATRFISELQNLSVLPMVDCMHGFSSLNFNLPDKCIYQYILNEIYELRLPNLLTSPKNMVKIVYYCSFVNVYLYDLVDIILSREFLHATYGKKINKFTIPRYILTVNNNILIDRPDYKGTLLDDDLRKSMTQFVTYDKIDHEFIKATGAFTRRCLLLDIKNAMEKLLGVTDFTGVYYVVPHLLKEDLIFVLNNENVPQKLPNIVEDDIIRPSNEHKWYCIVESQSYMDDNCNYGNGMVKKRQLEKLGYKVILVFRQSWLKMSLDEKTNYLRNQIFT